LLNEIFGEENFVAILDSCILAFLAKK